VVVSALPDVPLSMGVNRVVPGVAITHLLGDPARPPEAERQVRRAILTTALEALATEVSSPTLFPVGPGAGRRRPAPPEAA
jgi:glycine reductase